MAGWFDLRNGPLVLNVPDMNGPDSSGRYYREQFTDPSKNTNFAYVGKRTTGTQAGGYLITGPDWNGTVPQRVKQISSPNNAVLLLGRVFVYSDSDLSTADGLSKQIQLTPQSQWQDGSYTRPPCCCVIPYQDQPGWPVGSVQLGRPGGDDLVVE